MKNLVDLVWNEKSYLEFIKYLKDNADEKYRKFQLGILGVHKEIIGIKTPILRNLAQEITKGNWNNFICYTQKYYYEESVLKGLVIGYANISLDKRIEYIEEFIKDIDNWAVCDICVGNFKFIKENKEYFYPYIKECIKSINPWKIRVGLVAILIFYMDTNYLKEIFYICENIISDDYYVKMAQAWLISILFINFRDETLIYLQENNLDSWVQNKGIQKIRESTRVSVEDKRMILNYKK